MYGRAHADLLCTCVASVRVQTLVACICRCACAVAWRQRLPPYLEPLSVCDRPKSAVVQFPQESLAFSTDSSVSGFHLSLFSIDSFVLFPFQNQLALVLIALCYVFMTSTFYSF